MGNSKWSKDNYINFIVIFSISIFFLLMLAINVGYRYGASIIALMAIIVVPLMLFKKQSFQLTKEDRNILIILAIYSLSLILINMFHQNTFKKFDYGFRLLLAVPIFLLLYKFPIKPIWFFIIITVTTIIGSSIGYYNHMNYDWACRATVGRINTIHYASIIQLFAFISLMGISFVKEIKNKLLQHSYCLLVVIAFCMGIYLSILSYSRGVWLALPIQLLFVSVFYFKYNKKSLKTIVLLIPLVLTSGYLVKNITDTMFEQQNSSCRQNMGITKRFDAALSNIKDYKEGHTSTSVGLRLAMYKFAFDLAKENPLLGSPVQKIKDIQKTRPEVNHKALSHFHNHFLQILARYGLVGLILLLGLYLFSFISFWQRCKDTDISVKCLGVSGMLLLFSYAIYSLTDVLFKTHLGLSLYIIVISVICGATGYSSSSSADNGKDT